MSTFCAPSSQFSYLDSTEFYSICLHIQATVATPLHLFGAYCILFKTPQTMISVKWTLFNYHVMTFILDFMGGVLVCPYIIVPSFTSIQLGLFQKLGAESKFQMPLFLFTMKIMYFATILLFENRFFALSLENVRTWRKFRIPWMIMNYIICGLTILPIYFSIPHDQENMKSRVLEKFPCLPESIHNNPSLFVYSENTNIVTICTICLCIPMTGQLFFFAEMTRYTLRRQKDRMSENTLKLQRQFLKVLNTQEAAVSICLGMPMVYFGIAGFFEFYHQRLNNLAFYIIALYGVITAILTIFMHHPYRKFVFELLGKRPAAAPIFIAPSIQSGRLMQ